MPWNKKQLKNCSLYLILDRQVCSYDELFAKLKVAVRAGVDIVQLRDKYGSAKDILAFSRKAIRYLNGRAAYIINDRIDLALLCGADGVHLGQEDINLSDARRLLGKKLCIGVSCQNLVMAKKAQRDGADYIGFGSVFKTLTKPDRNPMNQKVLKKVLSTITIPVFPIGGISVDNISQVVELGASRVAVCRDILLTNNVSTVVKQYKILLETV